MAPASGWSLARHDAHQSLQEEVFGRKKGEFEREPASLPRIPNEEPWRGYTEEEVEMVRGWIENFSLRTVGSIVACARTFQDNYITGNAIGAMCRDATSAATAIRFFCLRRKRNEGARPERCGLV